MPIRILPIEVANQIAAGEVVERPASVVKELIENSLDAGATDLRVEIREGGRRLVRVQDDGCGIPAAEAGMAFARHATSKITTADDLTRLTTLGFRGEALASIAAVAQVALLTRARDEEIGALIRVGEGREIAHEPYGGPAGTILTVEHLFANVPARLKFLKQPATEAGHTQQIVTRYALAYPDRRFSLVSDGKLVFLSTGSGKLYDVLVKVYGLEMARDMIEIGEPTNQQIRKSENRQADEAPQREDAPSPTEVASADTTLEQAHSPIPNLQSAIRNPKSEIRVSGYIGAPTLHRSHRGYITLFINRRWFQDTSIAYSVIQAYHTLLPTGRYPVGVIFIEIEPAEVDVNVHPTKAEVRFRDHSAIFSAVQRSVRRTLTDHLPLPALTLRGDAGTAMDGPAPAGSTAADDPAWAERRAALLAAGDGQRRLFPAASLDTGGSETQFDRGQPDGARRESGDTPAPPTQPLLPLLRVIGQVAATYIICEGPDGMYLVDQHAAHERVLYEQFLAEQTAHTVAIQPLLAPAVLDLSPEQAAVVAEQLDALNELGIRIEPFGGSSYLVRSIPAILNREDPQAALSEIIDGLARADNIVESAHEAALVTLICKRAAVKGGQVLSLAEMQELVRRLEKCRSPRTCPHGRPTMIYLSASELARQFGRM